MANQEGAVRNIVASDRWFDRSKTVLLAVACGMMVGGSSVAGTLTVTAAARYAGIYGLQVGVGDGQPAFVRDDTPLAEARYRVRFYLRTTSLASSSGREIVVFRAVDATEQPQVELLLRKGALPGFELRWRIETDSGPWETPPGDELAILPGRHAVEIDYQAALAGVEGRLSIWVDGGGGPNGPDRTYTPLANSGSRIDAVQWGAVAGDLAAASGMSGNLGLDEFVSHRTDYIGPMTAFVDVVAGTDGLSDEEVAGIDDMWDREIMFGCGGDRFCPNAPVQRQQLAVYLWRAAVGPGVPGPSPCPSPPFADVAADDGFCPWIAAMANNGCGGGNFCPTDVLSREQAALLLARASGDSLPSNCLTSRFADVPPSSPFCPSIEWLADHGLTGCGGGNFCPSEALDRATLAVMMSQALPVN